jgi:glutamate transport system substrate-binding protein
MRGVTKGRRAFCACVICLAVVAAACGGENPAVQGPAPSSSVSARPTFAAGSYMADLQNKGKIVIGVKYDVPQFGLLSPATNMPEGFDVDLGKIIAARLGVPAEFQETISSNRIPFLQNDKVDLVISTMTINDERKQQIDFSVVYYLAGQTLLVKKSSPITSVKALNDMKGNVCSVKGSTSEANIRKAAPQATVTLLDTYSQCFQLLQNDQTQAFTTDDVILVGFLKQDPANFKLTGGTFSKEPYGMGMKKGRAGFKDFVDGVIKDVKKDGTWVKLYDKWIKPVTGSSQTPPPDDVAATGPSPAA